MNTTPAYRHLSKAFSWGYWDAREGKSEFEGYNYFAGERLSDYMEGYCAGRITNRRLAEMDEAALMDSTLAEIRSDTLLIAATLTADDLAAMSREVWGEEEYMNRMIR